MEKKKEGVSRQTLWQRKHRALGLCVVCSEPAYKGWRCVKHYEQHKIVMRLRYIPRVRGRYDVGGSMEFLEAAQRAARRGKAKGPAMTAGGVFGPLPAAATSPEALEAPAAKPAPAKDGRTLQAKRNKTSTARAPRAKAARSTRSR
jgi:hypothetical protein